MSYINVYPSRINWENEPNISTPLNATNLNKTDYALYSIDQTLAGWDTSKANQSDLLLCVKSIDFDDETGVFVFTWQNGTTKTIDLNIEKIPVSFSMDANGVITMTTDDGTTYTADVGALIKTYTFTDSTTIDFTVTTDASGNKTITADIIDGSITGTKLQPNYLADCQTAATNSGNSANASAGSANDSEAWAVGTRGGVPVPSTDPAYNNNSYYWSQHGASSSLAGLTDTDINTPQDGQLLGYNGTAQKWENVTPTAGGGSTIEVTTAESSLHGKTVTITDGTTTLSETFDNSGEATFTGVTLTGTLTITASDGTSTATKTLSVPYFGNYSAVMSFFTATITATFPSNHGATCTCDGQTSSSSPHNFTVNAAGTYNVVCTLDGISKTESVTITTDGQTVSKAFEYGTINLTISDEFRSQTITCVNGGTTITKTAPSSGNTMAFYPPTTGTWTISGTVSGTSYSTTATVSSLSTPVSASLESIPNGSTVTPTDDIQTWLKCAGITDKAYTTLSEVLADTDTYVTLLGDSNACDYMARSTTWASTIVADADAMRLLGMYDYACDALLGNATWASAIAGSTYFESVLTDVVPAMTSNTTPSGTASASSSYSGYYPYLAFNGIEGGDANDWLSNSITNQHLTYDFGYSLCVKRIYLGKCDRGGTVRVKNFKILASNDNFADDSHELYSGIHPQSAETIDLSTNTDSYRYYRIYVYDAYGGSGSYIAIAKLQYYGRHTAQTDIIHSAPSDTIYYMDNGNPVTLCTTDSSGVGTVDWSDLPTGDITLYSSVAKDPDDLTADYSKTIKVTKNKVEGYLMPDTALYWYGYKGALLQDISTANGWSRSGSWTGMTVPSYQTNYVSLKGSSSSTYSGIGVSSAVNANKVIAVLNPLALSPAGYNGYVAATTSKAITNSPSTDATHYAWATSTGLQVVEKTITQGTYYPHTICASTSECYVSALWYE